MKKVLVYWNITDEQKAQIKKIADSFDYQTVFTTDMDLAREEAADAEIMFGTAIPPLKAASELKWFCSHSAGVNAYVVPGVLPNEECLLSNSSGAYGVTIAEHITMVSIMMMRSYAAYADICATETWTHDVPMTSLHGCRITMLGTGDIGTTFAKRVKSFEPAQINGVNRSGRKPDEIYDQVVTWNELEKILPETDLLVMSLPETPETIDIMNDKMIRLLPQGAYLVNVGRGTAIEEPALIAALNEGRLAGAALDVMKTEPMKLDDPLRSAKNIVLTPHTAGQMTLGYTRQKSVDMFCEDLEAYLSGGQMKHLVDKKAGY